MRNPVLKQGNLDKNGDYTLRDKFAGQAMQGILASPNAEHKTFAEIAEDAYIMAYAMLKERLKDGE